jgi:hypothetical protein
VFGDRYTARSVVGERHFEQTRDYIAANPAKSGLLDDGRTWPWLWFDGEAGDVAKGLGTG